ncbi:hypothetical protein B0H16DRAFT_328735 [Mycena metata]|uniref:Uncharacterized protein n=1 Tax=Mycena metata TaxID=1033252 RepID=A0AAD7HML6_9AGAR|nr:hypothetical protein B0H16DRAFT_328735 [Mycena metata]
MMGGCATIFLFIILAHPMDTARIPWIACIVIHWLLFSLDGFYFIEIARYRAEKTVLTWLESKLSRDSIPAGGRPALKAKLFNFWSGLWQSLRRGQGAIVLSDDDDPPIEPSVPFTVPTQLYDDVFDWLRLTGDPSTRKVLWITVDRHKINTCVSDTIEFLSAVDKTISVDASRARSIFWPLLCGLGVAWPEFKQQLAWSLVECGFDYTEEGPLHRLLFRPLEEIWKIDHRNSGGDYESQQPEEIPLVVIHSIRDLAQARELCDIMEDVILKKSLNIIAISTRELRKFSWGQRYKMEHSHTLSLSETGTVINSGKLPWFHKNLFLLVLEGIFRSPKEVYERLSIELYGPAASSLFERPELSDPSTLTVFHLLHKAAEDRKQILKICQ